MIRNLLEKDLNSEIQIDISKNLGNKDEFNLNSKKTFENFSKLI